MSVQLVSNHILFPHLANWVHRPKWQRIWSTAADSGITGNEERLSARPSPRILLSYQVSTSTQIETAKLWDRLQSAKKAGLGAAPYWGRGSVLAQNTSGASLVLENNLWGWAAGALMFLRDPLRENFDLFDIRSVSNVNGLTITLDSALSRVYSAGTLVWPLILGKFSCSEPIHSSESRLDVEITITER
jgi:hypothetical protein